MIRWRRRRGSAAGPASPSASVAQLDNRDLSALIADVIAREGWTQGRARNVVEVGTGGGEGSTVAIHRALTADDSSFEVVGYEGDPELADQAARYWSDADEVRVVNEYFMHRDDIDRVVRPRITPNDRPAYLPVFDAVAGVENFLVTPPPSPIDLLFIDSVRYTHVAILRAARPWLGDETIVVMEDDIPEYGELSIVESEFELRDVSRHKLDGHPWPLVEFRVVG